MRGWWLALGLLTRIPVLVPADATPHELGRSVLFFPLVGLLLGGILAAGASALSGIPSMVAAAGLLLFWVGLTGALHLDGLADTVDAFAGGAGDRTRTLMLLKDPHAGPMAVVVLVLHLLLKFSCLLVLLASDRGFYLIWPPFFGRLGILLLFLTTPYARPGGMGDAHVRHLPKYWGFALLASLLLPLPFLTPGFPGLVLFLLGVGLLRHTFMQRLGGTTGDTAGALCEGVEVVMLLFLAIR